MRRNLLINTFIVSVFLLFSAMCCGEFDDYEIYEELREIELSNIDYSHKTGFESDSIIKKEAYVIGIKFKVCKKDSVCNTLYDHFYYSKTDNINLSDKPIVICNNNFNAQYTAGSNISELFSYTNRIGSTKDCDYFLVLRTAPDAGIHSFTVRYICNDSTIVENTTLPVELY